MEVVYDFQESLALSHAADDLPLWRECYKQAFPDMVTMVNHRQDGPHQRAGIDRSVILANSKQILIDEKVRGRNRKTGKVYDDILLEYLSNDKTGAPGWVCKPLLCDYIAYAIAPLGRCYLLPVLQLQTAWRKNKDHWLSEYRRLPAQNTSYTTWSIALPASVLFPAIGRALRFPFTPVEVFE